MAKRRTTKTTKKTSRKRPAPAAAKKAGKRAKPARSAARPATRPMLKKRADLGKDVGVYFSKLGPQHRSIADKLHGVVRDAAPQATGAVKWGMPVYEHKGMLCYIRSRPRYVTFGFYRQGTHLNDPKRMLEGSGDAMRHIKIALGSAVDEPYLKDLVRQAARYNEDEAPLDAESSPDE